MNRETIFQESDTCSLQFLPDTLLAELQKAADLCQIPW